LGVCRGRSRGMRIFLGTSKSFKKGLQNPRKKFLKSFANPCKKFPKKFLRKLCKAFFTKILVPGNRITSRTTPCKGKGPKPPALADWGPTPVCKRRGFGAFSRARRGAECDATSRHQQNFKKSFAKISVKIAKILVKFF